MSGQDECFVTRDPGGYGQLQLYLRRPLSPEHSVSNVSSRPPDQWTVFNVSKSFIKKIIKKTCSNERTLRDIHAANVLGSARLTAD